MKNIIVALKREYFIFFIALLGALVIIFFNSPVILFFVFLPILLSLCLVYPKHTIFALAFFLLFQDLIALWFVDRNLLTTFIKRIEEIVIIMVFILMQVRRILFKKPWKSSIIDFPLLILLFLAILSSFKNHFVLHLYALYDLGILTKGFLIFYIFYNFEINPDDIYKAVKMFLSVSLFIAMIGIIDLLFPAHLRALLRNSLFIDYRFGIASVQSIFTHPTVFGWAMACAALFSIACFLYLNKKHYLLLGVFFIFCTMTSMRVKAIGGMVAGILVGLSIIPAAKKVRAIFIIPLLVLVFILLFGAQSKLLFEDNIYTYFQSPYSSDLARNALYSTSFRIAADYFPLGAGLATFGGWISALHYSPLYSRYGLNMVYGLQESGNFIMDTFWPYIIGQIGVVGTIMYILIIILLFVKVIGVLNDTKNSYIKMFSMGTAMMLAQSIITSIGEPVFLKAPQYFFIFACLGISYSLTRFIKE